jgi:hypothetical protein
MSGRLLGRFKTFESAGSNPRKIIADYLHGDAAEPDRIGSHPPGCKVSEDSEGRHSIWQGDALLATYEAGALPYEDDDGVHMRRVTKPENQFVQPKRSTDRFSPGSQSGFTDRDRLERTGLQKLNAAGDKLRADWSNAHDQ